MDEPLISTPKHEVFTPRSNFLRKMSGQLTGADFGKLIPDNKPIDSIMKEIFRGFRKIFPKYIDTGYKMREAILTKDQQQACFLCGSATLVTFTVENQKYQTFNMQEIKFNKMTLNEAYKMIYVSTDKTKVLGFSLENLNLLQEFETEYLDIGLIKYKSKVKKIYGLAENVVFSIDIETKESEKIHQGDILYFKYHKKIWLLGYKSGKIRKISEDCEKETTLEGKINFLQFSKCRNHVLALVSTFVYKLDKNLEVKKKFDLETEPIHAIMTKDEKFLIVSTMNGKIAQIDISAERVLTIPVHYGKISYFVADEDAKIMKTFGYDAKMGIFHKPKTTISKSIYCNCSGFVFNSYKPEVFYIENNKSVFKWNFLSGEKTLLYKSAFISNPLCKLPEKNLIVFSDFLTIFFFNISTNQLEFEIPLRKVELTSIHTNEKEEYLMTLASENSFIAVYDLKTQQEHGKMSGHSARVICQVTIPGSPNLASGGNDKNIIIWDYIELKKIKILKGHTQPVTALNVSKERSHQKLVSGSKDFTIKIWNWRQCQLLMTLNYHTSSIVKLCMSKYNSLVSVSSDGMMSYWNLKSYVKIFSSKINTDIIKFRINQNSTYMGFSDNDEIRVVEFPISAYNLDVIGPNMTEKYEYISYIMKILNGDKIEYNKKWDDWTVLPYMFNTMHFFSFCNMFRHIKAGICHNTPICPSIYADPFSLIINKNYQKCLKVLFESTKYLLSTNLYALTFLNGSLLIQLNKEGHSQLHRFYSAIFKKYEGDEFPKFGSFNDLPKYVFSDTLTPSCEKFFPVQAKNEPEKKVERKYKRKISISEKFNGSFQDYSDDSDDELNDIDKERKLNREESKGLVPIVLYLSAIKMNYFRGSQDSINFISSLLQCPNKEVFRTRFIQSLLQSKWNQIKNYQLLQLICYGIYLVYLGFYIIHFLNQTECVIILQILVCLLSLYDVFQIHNHFPLYLRDIWNYFDILRLLFTISYSIQFFNSLNYQYETLTIVTLVSLIRGISFFRLFSETRYIIQLLLSILIDIKSFVILLAYSSISFSLIFMVQGQNSDDLPYIVHFKNSLLMNIGEYNFNFDNYKTIDWLIFGCAASANVIIMMNMLIAIMGETFNNVRENLELADFIELTKIVLDIEIAFSMNRKKGNKTFFQMCEAEIALGKNDELAKDIKDIKKSLKVITDDIRKKSKPKDSDNIE